MKAASSRTGVACVMLLASVVPAAAHELGPSNFAELNEWWVFEPGVVIPLALSALCYGAGVWRLRQASNAAFGISEIGCYFAGWATLVIALVSPLHPWGAVLFSAHMTQHELLMLVAAPLLVLGQPMIPFLWALPRSTARTLAAWTKEASWQRIWKTLTAPFVAWLVHAVVLWTWHLPFLFQATRASEIIHACGMRPVSKALERVRTIASWPIRSSKVRGRYLRARTR